MDEYRSAEVGQLFAALSKAQGAYKPLVANEDSPKGKYANLEAIIAAVKDALSANEISFFQHIKLLDEGSGAALLWTYLGHSSGQYIGSCERVYKAKTLHQTGNGYEINKRIQAMMLLGIAPSKNDPYAFDDDGQEIADQALLEKLKKPKEKKELDRNDTITKAEYEDMLVELHEYEEIAKDIMEYYNIDSLADLPRSEYHQTLARIRRIKKNSEEYLQRTR